MWILTRHAVIKVPLQILYVAKYVNQLPQFQYQYIKYQNTTNPRYSFSDILFIRIKQYIVVLLDLWANFEHLGIYLLALFVYVSIRL